MGKFFALLGCIVLLGFSVTCFGISMKMIEVSSQAIDEAQAELASE